MSDYKSSVAPAQSLTQSEGEELLSLLSITAQRSKRDYMRLHELSAKSDRPDRLTDRERAELDTLLKQYESLRVESLITSH